ncbi:hypothetical protein F5X99DRAFT_421812 [Biscogniauxia marginata]|nr:hypothetical protein F5X99DRAFT_421812 [Biscogniauxia marginata]
MASRLAFLPFLLAICNLLDQRSVHLPRHTQDIQGRSALSTYAIAALMWGLATADTFLLTERKTSAICPEGWCVERLIPLTQLITLSLDAVLIVRIGRLRQSTEEQAGTWRLLGTLFLTSAAVLAFLAVWFSVDPINYGSSLSLTRLVVVDLITDSVAVTVGVISSIYLLGVFHSTTVGLLVVATSVFVSIQSKIVDRVLIEVWSSWWGVATGIVVFLGVGVLLQLGKLLSSHSTPPRESVLSKNRYVVYAVAAFLLVFCQTVFTSTGDIVITPEQLIADAKRDSNMWIAMAARSTTLQSAVLEYKQRYGLPPPPNFDKWYEFAIAVKSPIIDTFDQINSDLLPYWGESPATLRQKTAHLLEHPVLSMGGLIIEDGKVEISPHVPGTHAWMLLVVKSMIEPFSRWLPDMQLVFNLDDECRISVPFARMKAYVTEAVAARARLDAKQKLLSFGATQDPPWSKEFLGADEKIIWEQTSPWFFQKSKSPIFYEWVSPTCPADSPASHYHWWNRKAECLDCSSPHMTDGFVSNWALAGDLCHQSDLAYLHGFLTSPSAMAPSHELFPVFSQSRIHNFADILYPSPWNFGDKVTNENEKTISWAQKLNSVFWRGASSDGFSTHGTWQMFMRARFVYLVTKARASFGADSLLGLIRPSGDGNLPDSDTSVYPPSSKIPASLGDHLVVNVSFVGDFTRCDGGDCAAEHTTFYGSPTANPPPNVDFEESWQHRHLVDFDGAAFSGRFLPFLSSASLPYRAALFRTWWEERIHAWRHFVPLDVRLADFWPALSYFGGSAGAAEGEEIATAGRDWAQKALRKEDMQVYMFRLLLEWARIVDDRREDLGFSPD